eukprot:4959133-Pyramimonas_sp.AAC.1
MPRHPPLPYSSAEREHRHQGGPKDRVSILLAHQGKSAGLPSGGPSETRKRGATHRLKVRSRASCDIHPI